MNRGEKDKEIIERVKAGEQAAFRELVNTYKDDAFALACSILKEPELAEDVLQEVFLKVFQKIRSFKYQSSFYTWLYRIVVNRSYNELRRNKSRRTEVLENVPESQQGTDLPDPNNVNEYVILSLNQMKADEALVLRLFYLSELSIEEVIQVTGFGKSKVKVSLHRGRKNLADLLRKYLGKEIEDL
ncbi:MAG: sigma-70 family RNA polymerase sigma factor [Bacteroidota bacterium]